MWADTVFKTTEKMRATPQCVTDSGSAELPRGRSRSPPVDRTGNRSDGSEVIDVTRQDSADSLCSDAYWEQKCRVTTLRATVPEV